LKTAVSSTKVRKGLKSSSNPIDFGSSGRTLSRALIRKAFRHLCESSKTSRGLLAWILYENEQYEDLQRFAVDPSCYFDAEVYFLDVRIFSFFKKYSSFDTGVDKKTPALSKWKDAENRCLNVNNKFRDRSSGKFSFPPSTEDALWRSTRKIASILGTLRFDDVRANCRHGPGADLGTLNNRTAAYWKYASRGQATPGALALMQELFSEDHVSDISELADVVDANRMSFVPKTSLIDRIIAVEPRWNMFIQLGLGDVMSARLRKKSGIDIRDQSRNQAFAKRAYDDGLATIDLSAASDSVCKNLVLELLPDDWFDALASTRSPYTILPDKSKWLNEKFSSMGNGYTFPLETLIFYALATSVVESMGLSVLDVGVYGDDIIVPAQAAVRLIEVLGDLGFVTNSDKTFIDGVFYESCGMDFFAGVPVRPFYLREEPNSWAALVQFVNGLCFCNNGHPGYTDDRSLRLKLHPWLIRRVPPSVLPLGPVSCPGVLWTPGFEAPLWGTWEGYRLRAWVFRPRGELVFSPRGLLLSKLSRQGEEGHRSTKRGDGEWVLKKVFFPLF
jgi:hypothetical protein